jgi:hypothetical protein
MPTGMPNYRKMRPVAGQCGPVRAAVRGGFLRRPKKALVAEQRGGKRTVGPLVVDNSITVVNAVVVLGLSWTTQNGWPWRVGATASVHEFKNDNTEFRTTFRQRKV